MKRYQVTLDADERQHLHDLIASGKAAARRAIARSWAICDNRDVRSAVGINWVLDVRIVVRGPLSCHRTRIAFKIISPA
jgi:hypothetical protein